MQIVVDLSGKGGLADNSFGDEDSVFPQPNRRVAKDGEMVQGWFNPYLRNGYLAPIVIAGNDNILTPDEDVTGIMAAIVQDAYGSGASGHLYYADREGGQIFSDNPSINRFYLDFALDDVTKNMIHDMELYSIDDKSTMFVTNVREWEHDSDILRRERLFKGESTNGYIALSHAMNPASGSEDSPRLIYKSVLYRAADEDDADTFQFSDEDNGIYIPAGRGNLGALLVVFDTQNGGAPAGVSSATIFWDNAISSTLSLGGSGDIGNDLSVNFRSFYAYDIQPGLQGDIRVVIDDGAFNGTCFLYVFDNCLQTTGVVSWDGSVVEDAVTSDKFVVTKDDADSAPGQTVVLFGITAMGDNTDARHTRRLDYVPRQLDSTVSIITGEDLGAIYSTWEIRKSATRTYLSTFSVPSNIPDYNWSEHSAKQYIETTDSTYNFLRKADNGFLYYFRDNAVDKIDGTITGGSGGTLTKNVLLFPDSFLISDAIDYRSKLYIAVHQNQINQDVSSLNTLPGKCGIYVWNRISVSLTGSDFIELPGVREIKKIYASPDGIIKLITVSANGLTEIRQFGYNDSGGVVFPVIKQLGLGAFPQYPNGLVPAGDKVMWLGNDATLYCEKGGSVTKLKQFKDITYEQSTDLSQNINSGAIWYNIDLETAPNGYRSDKQSIIVSYWDSALADPGSQIIQVYPFDINIDSGEESVFFQHEGEVFSGVKDIPITSIVRNIRIYNLPVKFGSSTPTEEEAAEVLAQVQIYFNQSDSASMEKSIDVREAMRGYVDFKVNTPYVHAVQFQIQWSGAIKLGYKTYLPSVAVITTEETPTQSPDNN